MKPLLEKKSSTKDVDKGTYEQENTPFLEKKYFTKNFDKGTYELAFMKKTVVTIRRKGLDKFEDQSKGSTEWFKLDGGFFKHFLQFIQNSLKTFENNIEDKNTELYTTFIVPFFKEYIRT